MASIATYLQKILDAVYGEEVRGSIHDAISAMNEESSNAMQYASTAKDSAQASATAAAASATTATQKASAASTSATNAAASATTASQKATAAAISETNAASSESNAKTSETNAATAATNAAASAASAAQNGELARISATSAKLSEDNAVLSELAAQESAMSAQESADQAKFYSGKPPKPYNGTWWIWDMDAYDELYDSSGNPIDDNSGTGVQAVAPGYIDTHISCELVGPQGNGISDIVCTSGDHSPGTTDVYTIIMTDGSKYTIPVYNGSDGNGINSIALTQGDHSPGTTDVYTVTTTDGSHYTISVYNGQNGEGVGDVCGISFDLTIPAAGWSSGRATIADERLIAQSVYKYFIAASNASRLEFLDCDIQPDDIETTGFLVFTCRKTPANDLTVNVIRMELSTNG